MTQYTTRTDSYTSQDGQTYPVRVRTLDARDTSRQYHSGYRGGDRYDPRCSCCWLGQPHSLAYHLSQTGEVTS